MTYHKKIMPLGLSIALLPLISACDLTDSNNNNSNTGNNAAALDLSKAKAVLATNAADFSSGATSIATIEEPRAIQNNLSPTDSSDIFVVADETHYYRVERKDGDNVTKYSFDAPTTAIWQYSTMDAGEQISSNPHDFVIDSDTKAYILRYDKPNAWIVDPSASESSAFKTGEIDLSAYDSDGVPQMDQGIIIGNKLFITTQAMDSMWAPGLAHLVVIDTTTDSEINTAQSSDPAIKGIPLPIKSPEDLTYSPDTGKIYIQGAGRLAFPTAGIAGEYSGGIISVDPQTYEVEMLVDDGNDQAHPYGNITNLAIVSADKAYFTSYAGWGDNSLYSFNPTTGEVNPTPITGVVNKHISDIAVDPTGKLWVSSRKDFGIIFVDTNNDTTEDSILSTGAMAPDGISFTHTP